MIPATPKPGLERWVTSAVQSSAVLFIHGSLCNRRMWRSFEAALSPRVTVAVDLPGYGDAAGVNEAASYRLEDAVRAIRPSISQTSAIDVVAHSFGAAVALRLALESPNLVRTLTLVEPSCFFVLRDMGPRAAQAVSAIKRIGSAFSGAADQDRRFAMARFINYWNGNGAWVALRPDQQDTLVAKSSQVRRDFEAIFGERLHLGAFRKLVTPTLIVTGTASPAAALLVADGLTRAAARASSIAIQGAGHMLPMTHELDLIRILRTRLRVGSGPELKAA